MNEKHNSNIENSAFVQEIANSKLGKKYYLSGSKALIGRNLNAEIPVNHANVSRNHAAIEFSKEAGWCIMDNKSINGVYLDGQKLKPCNFTPLSTGQKIFFGPPEMTSYGLEFHVIPTEDSENKQPTFEINPSSPGCSHEPSTSESKIVSRKRSAVCSSTPVTCKKKHSPSKRECESLLKERVAAVDSLLKMNEAIDERVRRILNQSDDTLNDSTERPKECSESILGDHNSLPDINWSNWSIEDLQCPNTSKPSLQDDIYDRCTQVSSMNKEELTELQKKVALLEKELQEREKTKLELQAQLQQKETLLKEEREQKEALQKIEEKKLQSSLSEAQSLKQKVNSEVASQFGELLDSELTCTICTELFVKATTLTCSHTFCQDCLEAWMKSKTSNHQCPICRTRIMGTSHSFVIDGFIDKMVEKLSKEDQEKRKQVLLDRSKPQKKVQKPKKAPKRQSRAQNRRNRRQNIFEVPLNSTVTQDLLAELIDLEESTYNPFHIGNINVVDDDVVEIVEVPSDTSTFDYYGGYGRCYNCGGLGHWANFCPEA